MRNISSKVEGRTLTYYKITGTLDFLGRRRREKENEKEKCAMAAPIFSSVRCIDHAG